MRLKAYATRTVVLASIVAFSLFAAVKPASSHELSDWRSSVSGILTLTADYTGTSSAIAYEPTDMTSEHSMELTSFGNDSTAAYGGIGIDGGSDWYNSWYLYSASGIPSDDWAAGSDVGYFVVSSNDVSAWTSALGIYDLLVEDEHIVIGYI